MPDKKDTKEPAAPEKPAPAGEKAPAGDKSAAAAQPAGGSSKLPLFVAAGSLVLAPLLSLAVAQFVLLPRLEKKLAGPDPAPADAAASDADSGERKGAKDQAPPTYEFSNVVVNLAGTMGTRYLKTSFIVTGPDATLHSRFESNKAKLTDVTLNVLSSLTLSDLEEPGSKNVLREKLVGAYNQALGRKVADQVYFSDFVVQ